MQILLFVLGWRPLGWTETLGLEGDPWAGRRPLGWKETLGLDGDPWAGRRPLACAGRAREVLQCLAGLKWASVQALGPHPGPAGHHVLLHACP